MLTVPIRQLGEPERAAVERILDADPYAGAQIAERVAAHGLNWWRSDGRIYGYEPDRHVESIIWSGAHLVPVGATPPATAAFADLLGAEPRVCSSIIGRSEAVLDLWNRLGGNWGPARDVRPHQPLLVTNRDPVVRADPSVRLVHAGEVDQLFPAAVAMYTEEVGVSPLQDDGGRGYRRRIAELVKAKRAYAKFDGDLVVFKAELAIVTRRTTQIQGVWVHPEYRGSGIATGAMATVVADALRRVAPTVSLYVNDYNTTARRVYARCGFVSAGSFATVLF
ncbi:N-acetyltransferase GCN5 [Actinoplanes lobatus]|uniref:N-acetyltransferase GCN5 n=1 Tax=Actinoplanes lobatus TaxID=113568 RepID=A0ABQ4ACN0_9ACTN|nr:GNAT family N-acetyltransferase [Actinoplanes lobatus]GGN53526.1 N-acetyltransferase GCN5 [Actinoplanes lobatus]GIE38734.1 N-acetyltransferase GCN5 [Actinoplanes lobatus]